MCAIRFFDIQLYIDLANLVLRTLHPWHGIKAEQSIVPGEREMTGESVRSRCSANKGLYRSVTRKREFTLHVEKGEDREVAVKHSRTPSVCLPRGSY